MFHGPMNAMDTLPLMNAASQSGWVYSAHAFDARPLRTRSTYQVMASMPSGPLNVAFLKSELTRSPPQAQSRIAQLCKRSHAWLPAMAMAVPAPRAFTSCWPTSTSSS